MAVYQVEFIDKKTYSVECDRWNIVEGFVIFSKINGEMSKALIAINKEFIKMIILIDD